MAFYPAARKIPRSDGEDVNFRILRNRRFCLAFSEFGMHIGCVLNDAGLLDEVSETRLIQR